MALDATVKGPNANSYLTLSAADSLAAARLYTDDWDNATDTTKEKALMWSSRLIDEAYDWYGAKRTLEQALDWPRVGMLTKDQLYVDPDTLPLKLQQAVIDQAIYLLQRDFTKLPALIGLGFSSATVGPLSVTVDKGAIVEAMSESILMSLREWGIPVGGGFGGMQQIPLSRS